MTKEKKLEVRPLFDKVLVTCNTVEEHKTEGGIIIPDSAKLNLILPEQTVVAVGPNAEQVKVGEEIILNPDSFKRPKLNKSNPNKYEETMEYVFPIEVINGIKYLLISKRDIKFVKV